MCKLYLFCFVVDQDEIAASSNQSQKLAGNFCLIPFGVIDIKGNGFSELVYLQWSPGKDDPSKHFLDISSSFSVLNPPEESAVRFSKIPRKILKCFRIDASVNLAHSSSNWNLTHKNLINHISAGTKNSNDLSENLLAE